MKRIAAGALAALTLASGAFATAAPASARSWHGDHRGGWGPGLAVGAGLLGLAVGAAITDHPHGYRPYDAPGYYGPGYGGCRTVMRWNPYWGEYQPVRACD